MFALLVHVASLLHLEALFLAFRNLQHVFEIGESRAVEVLQQVAGREVPGTLKWD
jgi:hypothetical protein